MTAAVRPLISPEKVTVYKKIHAVMRDAVKPAESGFYTTYGNYSKLSDVEAAIRQPMIDAGLIFHSYMVDYEWRDDRFVIKFQFDLIDIDTGSCLSSEWYGESMTMQSKKSGELYPDEEAIKKATTRATKNFLQRIFMLSSADDESDAYQTPPAERKPDHTKLKDELDKRELRTMRQDLFNLVERYFGSMPHNGSGKTKATRAGALLVALSGVAHSSELSKDQLVDLLALMQSHIDTRKTARIILRKVDVPGIASDGHDLYDDREPDDLLPPEQRKSKPVDQAPPPFEPSPAAEPTAQTEAAESETEEQPLS